MPSAAGVGVREPVYVDGTGTVQQADASASPRSCGICLFKPTPTTAIIVHQGYVTGYAGATPGNQTYVSTVAGGLVEIGDPNFPATPGTDWVQVMGTYMSASVLQVNTGTEIIRL